MRETIQDKVNSWFVEKRNGETGEYPDFPDKEDGGSKVRRRRGRPDTPPSLRRQACLPSSRLLQGD